jgi:hypothetical protein
MSIFVSRKGGFSVFRIGFALAIFGLVVIAGGFILFQVDQQKYKSPLSIDLYTGSEPFGETSRQSNSRELVYRVQGVDANVVADYYQSKLDDFYDNNPLDPAREKCVRTPNAGNFPDYVEGAGTVPYQFRCEFAESTFNANRSTTVTIQPGVRDDDAGTDNTGATIIQYGQLWER